MQCFQLWSYLNPLGELTLFDAVLLHIGTVLTTLCFLLTGWGSFRWMCTSGRHAGRFNLHGKKQKAISEQLKYPQVGCIDHAFSSLIRKPFSLINTKFSQFAVIVYLSSLARLILWISEADDMYNTCPFPDTLNVHNTLENRYAMRWYKGHRLDKVLSPLISSHQSP